MHTISAARQSLTLVALLVCVVVAGCDTGDTVMGQGGSGGGGGNDVCRTKTILESIDAAAGTADFRNRDGNRISLNIEVEDLLPGDTYRVFIDGNQEGTITTDDTNGIGKLDFDTDEAADPSTDVILALAFDAILAKSLEIKNPTGNDTVRLSTPSLTCGDLVAPEPPVLAFCGQPCIVELVSDGNGEDSFSPREVKIEPTQTVTWIYADGQVGRPHTVTNGGCPGPTQIFEPGFACENFPAVFDSETTLGKFMDTPLEEFMHTFNTVDTFPYHCNIHGSMMQGTVFVEPAP